MKIVKNLFVLLVCIIVVSCCGIMISCGNVFNPPKVVTYMNDQVQHDKIAYKSLKKAHLPTEPKKAGYTFVEWVQRANVDGATIEDKFDLVIFLEKGNSTDYTVYAKFVKDALVLNLNTNGGQEMDALFGEKFDNIGAPVKDKYSSFAGWYEDSNFLTRVNFPLTITQNTTIHARWIAVKDGIRYSYVGNGYQLVEYIPAKPDDFVKITLDNEFDSLPIVSIGAGAFMRKYITEINIPSTVTSIGESAFYNTDITTITIPNSVTKIGMRAFYMCRLLESVNFEEGSALNKINSEMFFKCIKLTSFIVPSNVAFIDTNVFEGCTKLTSVTFAAPTGWIISGNEPIINKDLTNITDNATFLTTTYVTSEWRKEQI